MTRFVAVVASVAAVSLTAAGSQRPPGFFTRLDPVIDAIWSGFDTSQAQQHVEFVSRYWRLAGNPGYDASLDRVHARLAAAGFAAVKSAAAAAGQNTPRQFFDEYPNTESGGWDHTIGTLAIAGSSPASDEIVLSREKERLALCINSFSTPPEGMLLSLYDVGRGDRDEDYAGKNLKGAVVLGDADAGQLWRRAVVNGGAAGVISTAIAPYVSPDPPGANPTPRDEWDILQWSSIPYDAVRKGFGFKASPRAAARLRRALATRMTVKPDSDEPKPSDHLLIRVTIASSFSNKPNRTLVAEIPGQVAPNERVILAAHVQEPGANDNASGVATLAELAVSLQAGIRAGKIPPPGRTLTFLFLNEIGGSRRWLQDHATEAKNVRYMISMDMTGEDVAKTGGAFLVERWPDPAAVWDRPWDPHSEWGRGNVKAEQLKGDLINDTHLTVCSVVARKTDWVVRTNPYEGGSDHTVFGSAGVPSVLDWHFTDRYYHTNFDTPDKTSAAEMRNVGVCAAASAWLLGSADAPMALAVAALVADAGKARIGSEERQGEKLAAADTDPAAARARESQILAAWRKWYGEAVRSASRLIVGPAPADFSARLDALAAPFEARRSSDAFESGGPADPPSDSEPDSAASQVPSAGQSAREPSYDRAIFVCGTDMSVPTPVPVKWDTVMLAGDGQLFTPCPPPPHGKYTVHPPEHRELQERLVLNRALNHRDSELRRLAVIAMGRVGLGAPSASSATARTRDGRLVAIESFGAYERPLNDESAQVRRAAVDAIGQSVSGVERELQLRQARTQEQVAAARLMLERRLKIETDSDVTAMIWETIGRLRYQDNSVRDEVQKLLIDVLANRKAPSAITLGATKGLEALIRGNPKREVDLQTREMLRVIASHGPTASAVPTTGGTGTPDAPGDESNLARARRLALMALQTARDDDIDTLVRAGRDADWQVRRLVALRLDVERVEFKATIEDLALDPVFQVRYEMLNVLARHATRTGDCPDLMRYFDDPEPTVVLRAIDLLPAPCGENGDAVKRLASWAEELKKPLDAQSWHAPAHALEALARLRPDAGRPFLEEAAKHPIWQVRARTAAACEAFKDEETARGLAADPEPNVRTAALETLVRLQSPARFEAAIEALKQDDYQLIRTAALALRGTPEADRDDTANALLDTLRRLTASLSDTSRDPRVAILERLGEILPAERTADLGVFREDFDRRVREATRDALAKITQAQSLLAPTDRYRYPYQPVKELNRLPTAAVITMDGGAIHLELLIHEAPVTVARFSELARAGYYDGLTFHRVVPNFVIQGGSPGANEYAGVARYMRDEVGVEPHTRGAVGISTRGPDTGDAQIFIDLVDIPRLDHAYTVFARVVSGLDVVERVLEGATIRSVTVK